MENKTLYPSTKPNLQPVQFTIQRVLEWQECGPEYLKRLEYAATLPIPHLPQLEPHCGKAIIVGSGPSVPDYVDQIRGLVAEDDLNSLFSVNAAHDWLLRREITPRFHVLFEDDIESLDQSLGGDPHRDVYYYICSQCPVDVFRSLEKHNRVLWHTSLPFEEYQAAVARLFPGEFMVSSGYATFFRCMSISLILGYRELDIFGVDSSFIGSSHVDGYAMADIEPRVVVWGRTKGGLKQFTTQGGLAFQAVEFMKFCSINQSGLKIRVHGDGLLRNLHEASHPEQYLGLQRG